MYMDSLMSYNHLSYVHIIQYMNEQVIKAQMNRAMNSECIYKICT